MSENGAYVESRGNSPRMPAIVNRLLRNAAYAAAVIAVTVGAQSCSRLPKPDPEDPRFKESLAEQKRINRYFHDVVVPRLNPCWDKVQGTGTVEIGYTFAKNAQGDWGFRTLKSVSHLYRKVRTLSPRTAWSRPWEGPRFQQRSARRARPI